MLFQLYSPYGEWYCCAVIFGFLPSDIRFASARANIISLCRRHNISFATGKNITPSGARYITIKKALTEVSAFLRHFGCQSAALWLFAVLLRGFFAFYAFGGKDNTERKRGGGDYQRCDGNAACV